MKKAVLIVHGFVGSLYDNEYLMNYLEYDKNFKVFAKTLPGHHTNDNYQKSEFTEWIRFMDLWIEEIINHGYKTIYIVGHSMGGVLACYLASKYSEIKKLVLAAPAFKYMTFDEDEFKLTHALKNSPKLLKYYSKEDIISRAIQFPRSVIKEFMKLVDESQELPLKIKCPILIIHGTEDQIVPLKSSKNILEEFTNNNKELMILDNVTHDIFRSDKKDEVNLKVKNFLNRWL